jgi:hypothetical protein
MAYNTQNYLVSGLYPSSGILNTGKHNISETGSDSVLRLGEGETYSVRSLRSTKSQCLRLAPSEGPNRVGVSLPSPADGRRSSFQTTVFSSIWNFGRWTSPETQ